MMQEIEKTRKLSDQEILEKELAELKEELVLAEARHKRALAEIGESQPKIVELSNALAKKRNELERRFPATRVEPPTPDLHVLLAKAKRQCPGRSEQELGRMVAQVLASMSASRAGENYGLPKEGEGQEPEMAGTEVRQVADSHYSIPAPPREKVTYE